MQVVAFRLVGEAFELDGIAVAKPRSDLRCPTLSLFVRDIVASEVERSVGIVRGSCHMLGAVVA